MYSPWQWTHVPWISAIIHWLSGIAAIVIAVLAPAEAAPLPLVFFGLGTLVMLCGFFIPKTHLSVSEDKSMLTRNWGPWLNMWCRTKEIPLDNVSHVILRWRNMAKRSRRGTIHTMVIRNNNGKEHDLFNPNCLPYNSQKCGRTLAEVLGVEFVIDGDKR